MRDLFNRIWCQLFHAGGTIGRDPNGCINWQCVTCGRYAKAVTHEEEVIAKELASYGFKRKYSCNRCNGTGEEPSQ